MFKKLMVLLMVMFACVAYAEDDPKSQFELGVKYFYGIGVEKHYGMAYSYFLKSAEQGDVDAQFNLAAMYRLGLGTLKDEVEAFEWNMKAALQGDEDANYNVCLMYRDGIGVKRSPEKALEWYTDHIKHDGHGRQATLVGMIYSGKMREMRHYKVSQQNASQ